MADNKKKKDEKKKKEDKLKTETDLDWIEWGIDSPLAGDKLKDTDEHPAQKPKKDDKKKKK